MHFLKSKTSLTNIKMLPESIEVSLHNKFKEQFFSNHLILAPTWDIQLYLHSWLIVAELLTHSCGHDTRINFKWRMNGWLRGLEWNTRPLAIGPVTDEHESADLKMSGCNNSISVVSGSEFEFEPCARQRDRGHTTSDALFQFCLVYKSLITWKQLTCQGEK